VNGFTIPVERGTVDLEARCLGESRLSPTEARLLGYLAARPGQVVGREELLREVWGVDARTNTRTVFSTMERLRRKIERDPKHPRHLRTVGREGYGFWPLQEERAEPRALSDFVGRGAELEALRRHVLQGGLVTVCGPPGVGKSRLAAELAQRMGPQLPEGAFSCEMQHARTPLDVVGALARATGVSARGDEPERELLRIGRALRSAGDALLVLDDCDASAAALGPLLQRWTGPRPALVLTGLAPLGIPGEQVLRLSPLTVDEGALLFVARVRDPRWVPKDRAMLEALVRELDGLPLAIELAARWSPVMDPDVLLARLQQQRLVLQGDEGWPAHHRTLQAAIGRVWDDLGAAERRVLAGCSVFRGGFGLEAVEFVLEEVLPGVQLLEVLQRLVDRSTLLVSRTDAGRRFSMLESIRKFAAAHLEEGQARALEARAASWFARMGEDEAVRALECGGYLALQRGAAELGNLEATLERGSPQQAGRVALVLSRLYRELGPVQAALHSVERALQRVTLEVDPGLHVRLRHAQATNTRYVSGPQAALALFLPMEALTAQHAPERLGFCCAGMGGALLETGQSEAARQKLEQALVLHRQDEDPYGEALVIAELGALHLRAGRILEATRQLQEALRLLRRLEAYHAEAVILGNLGLAHLLLGRTETAESHLRAALVLHTEQGSTRFLGQTHCNLALVELRRGRLQESHAHYLSALSLARRGGDLRDEAITSADLALLLVKLGDTAGARAALDTAEDLLGQLSLAWELGWARCTRVAVCQREGDLAQAVHSLTQLRHFMEEHALEELEPAVLAAEGSLALGAGDRAGAEQALGRARARLAEMGLAPGSEAGWRVRELERELQGRM
jgi:tetratricopeptide (TPR) repeat protein